MAKNTAKKSIILTLCFWKALSPFSIGGISVQAQTVPVAFQGGKWVEQGETWSYLPAGQTDSIQNALVEIDGNLYWFDESGFMHTGWKDIEGRTYYFDRAGACKEGWLNLDGFWYYGTRDGVLTNQWLQENNRWYRFDEKGVMKTGWILLEGNWYYLDQSGAMIAGRWAWIDGSCFYFSLDGSMKTGWHQENGKKYYLGKDGKLVIGWLQDPVDQACYMADEQGVIQTGIWKDPSTGTTFHLSETGQIISSTPYTVRGIPVINKKHGLPASYAPGEIPAASRQLRKMISAMQKAGYDISNSVSGFRSYETQRGLYNMYVAQSGQKEADTYSARPGYSEHQSGLAFDLKHTNGQLVERKAEAGWIEQHAHEYGFIVRYKAGWEKTTGYIAEPWHIRYIGKEAEAIYRSGLCLEDYLGVEGGDYR